MRVKNQLFKTISILDVELNKLTHTHTHISAHVEMFLKFGGNMLILKIDPSIFIFVLTVLVSILCWLQIMYFDIIAVLLLNFIFLVQNAGRVISVVFFSLS